MPESEGHLEIKGGNRLDGEVRVSGSKNACLPIMAATLLTNGVCVLDNVPRLSDVFTLSDVLRSLGAVVEWTGDHTLQVDTSRVSFLEPDPNLIKRMRASVLVLGPMLARFGQCVIPLPGGCSLGKRPIDLHLSGMEKLGAIVRDFDHSVNVFLPPGRKLTGTTIKLGFPSVGATENLMMAAAMADGTTVIENAAREPEISDLGDFLSTMGARVIGAGESTITVIGINELRPAKHKVIPDRIEAATYLLAAAITSGKIKLFDINPAHMTATLEKLALTGCRITTDTSSVILEAPDVIRPTDIRTLPYPGFSTDVQPPFMALMTKAAGESLFVEKIFERRFLASEELKRMGADIRVLENCALVNGGKRLRGCEVNAPDIRAAAAILIAALWADGTTYLKGLHHLFRGYENPIEKLNSLGAHIIENSSAGQSQPNAVNQVANQSP
ncbi:MAG: UDP-N-acetylglucosamine 1-carboxyvinyltransferase [bacterium]